MSFALRRTSFPVTALTFQAFQFSRNCYFVPRRSIPPSLIQSRYHQTFTDRVLYLLTGMKRLNPAEKEQAIIDHQKLAVVYYSLHYHEQVHEHSERVYSLQLCRDPKNFDIQQHYVKLVDRKKEELSSEELQDVVSLYQFAMDRDDILFTHKISFQQKLDEYRSLGKKI